MRNKKETGLKVLSTLLVIKSSKWMPLSIQFKEQGLLIDPLNYIPYK